MNSKSQKPFQNLGERLKTLRQSKNKSRQEVCNALELDPKLLNRIEDGVIRPSEEILMLLCNHFGAKEDEINKLWEAGGYKNNVKLDFETPALQVSENTLVMLINDSRIVYTDSANVSASDNGIVLSFMQKAPGGKPMAISRVGLSREHAKKLLGALWSAIEKTREHQQKALPPADDQIIS